MREGVDYCMTCSCSLRISARCASPELSKIVESTRMNYIVFFPTQIKYHCLTIIMFDMIVLRCVARANQNQGQFSLKTCFLI